MSLGYLQQGNPNLKIGRAQCFAYQNHPPTEDANRARILRPPRTATQKCVASLHPTHFSARALPPASSSLCELGKPAAQALHQRRPSSGASSLGSSPAPCAAGGGAASKRSEEHTSELQSPSVISYAVFCLKKKNQYHENSHAKHWDYHKTPLIGRQPT